MSAGTPLFERTTLDRRVLHLSSVQCREIDRDDSHIYAHAHCGHIHAMKDSCGAYLKRQQQSERTVHVGEGAQLLGIRLRTRPRAGRHALLQVSGDYRGRRSR